MKTPVLILLVILCTSCFKMPDDPYVPPVDVPLDFDWKTIETKNVVLTTVSSILNSNGDTIASYLPAGTYGIMVGKGATIAVNSEPVAVQTKAGGNTSQKIYFPSKNNYATVMFEDLFPSKGDMDMNDIVFGLNIEYNLTNQSRVNSITITIQPRAIGSIYESIGIAANLSSTSALNIIDFVTYDGPPQMGKLFEISSGNKGYSAELNVNFSEVVPLTGDFRYYFNNKQDLFINVINNESESAISTFSTTIYFKSNLLEPYSNFSFLDELSPYKVNLDIFSVYNVRSKEVHFKGQKATVKFNTSLFLATRPMTDFSTIDNWVWAIISDKSIRHPAELVKIYHAYPDFKLWAESSGGTNTNWYSSQVADSLYNSTYYSYSN